MIAATARCVPIWLTRKIGASACDAEKGSPFGESMNSGAIMAAKKASRKNAKAADNEAEKKSLSLGEGEPGEAMDLMRRQFGLIAGYVHELFTRLPDSLKVKRADARVMYHSIDEGARLKSLAYWLFIVSSCGIATLGLIINSPAVIIGAMLVSPLMSPIMGLGMGIAVNDTYLGVKSFANVTISVVASVVTAALITAVVPLHELTPEIRGRMNPTVLDLGVAILSGVVAALSSIRSGGDEVLKSVAPGAAIAVALMPPLCVVGFGLGIGFRFDIMWGAFLLFTTNLIAITFVCSVFYYFILVEYSPTRLIKSVQQVRTKEEVLFTNRYLERFWENIGEEMRSGKRFWFPLLLVALIGYPLTDSFILLFRQNQLRTLITQELQNANVEGLQFIRGPDALDYSRGRVSGTILYSSKHSPGPTLEAEVEKSVLERYPWYEADLTLIRVAGDADLSELRHQEDRNLKADAERQAAAASLVRRALALTVPELPVELGVVSEVRLLFSSSRLDTLEVHYLGEPLQTQTRQALSTVFKNKMQSIRGDVREVRFIREGEQSGRHECRGVTESALKRAKERLGGLFEPLRENPFLKLELDLAVDLEPPLEGLSEKQRESLKISRDASPRCLVEYRYTR